MNTKKRIGLAVVWFALAGAGCSSSASYGGAPDGGAAPSGSNSSLNGTLACEQKSTDGSDSDCVEQGKPRKLDCADEDELAAALAAGCVREDPKDSDDFDVCCPKTVSGTKPAPTSLACREKEDADDNPECAAFSGKPKKLDCDTEANVKAATLAGCVRQKSTSTDVCCPAVVQGEPD